MVKNLHNRRWTLALSILSCFLILLSGCGKSTELVCDGCGISFTTHGDYSATLAEDADLEALYGIDMYRFYCPDCIDPRMKGPLVGVGLSTEEMEQVLSYRAEKEAKQTASSKNKNKLPGQLLHSTGVDSYWVCETADGMYGIYNEETQALVDDMRYEQILTFDEAGMAWAYYGGYWGCIDQHGALVIPFQFSDVRDFQGEYAIVCMNLYGVIDRNGTFAIQPMYDEIKLYENVAQVKADKKYGLVNYSGEVMVAPENEKEFQLIGAYLYSGVREDRYGFTWGNLYDQNGQSLMGKLPVDGISEVSHASEGMIRARREGTTSDAHYYGLKEIYLLNESLELVTEQPYLYISDFSHSGYAAARPLNSYHKGYWSFEVNDGGWMVINNVGNGILTLPELSGGFSYNHYGAHYTYVNEDFAVADEWNGDYSLVDLHSDEKTEKAYIWTFEGNNCILVKEAGTELFSLYDGYQLVDSQCTDVKTRLTEDGDEVGLVLCHGATETVYYFS